MKYQIMTLLTLISLLSFANKLPPTQSGHKVDPTFIKLSESDKGTLFLNPKSCTTVMIRDNLEISLVKETLPDGTEGENFQIKFPDGDTVIGNISKTSSKLPACFHSLTTTSKDYRVKVVSYAETALDNCKKRPKDDLLTVTQELRHMSDKSFQKAKVENAGDAFMKAPSIKIQEGTGLSFYKGFNQQVGNIIKTADLKPKNDSYTDRCATPKKAPGAPVNPTLPKKEAPK